MSRVLHRYSKAAHLIAEQLRYRLPMTVRDTICYGDCRRMEEYCVCPRCGAVLEREFMAYCTGCGQKLDWRRVVKDE
ncbi:MAG: hypothetical protein LUD82_01480 [Clostridiales bacterium]|nr:hypothetical protein [Clostridiales bacterium]